MSRLWVPPLRRAREGIRERTVLSPSGSFPAEEGTALQQPANGLHREVKRTLERHRPRTGSCGLETDFDPGGDTGGGQVEHLRGATSGHGRRPWGTADVARPGELRHGRPGRRRRELPRQQGVASRRSGAVGCTARGVRSIRRLLPRRGWLAAFVPSPGRDLPGGTQFGAGAVRSAIQVSRLEDLGIRPFVRSVNPDGAVRLRPTSTGGAIPNGGRR